jgi:hypothetical protein
MDYHGGFVDVELAAVKRSVEPLPMDEELSRVQREHGQEERMRPGPAETCIDCGELVGDDPGARFHLPIQGPPSPLCGACARERGDQEDADEEADEDEADATDPANQSWCPACQMWLSVPTGGVCDVCGQGTTSEPVEKPDWRKIADGEDLEPVDGAALASTPAEADFAAATATGDTPIGDGPMPARPDPDEAVLATTPTRRKR